MLTHYGDVNITLGVCPANCTLQSVILPPKSEYGVILARIHVGVPPIGFTSDTDTFCRIAIQISTRSPSACTFTSTGYCAPIVIAAYPLLSWRKGGKDVYARVVAS